VLDGLRGQTSELVHVGGELLTCSAHEAAVMLLDPAQAQQVLAQDPVPTPDAGQLGVVSRHLAHDALPYLAPPPAARVVFNAVGGVAFASLQGAPREEALRKLRAADWIGVRDAVTHAALRAAGVHAYLLPDPAVLVAKLFGARITEHARTGEPARVASAYPNGYLAVQCSAEFEDDQSLATLAAQLDALARRTGFGLVLFRAGAAPWHDRIEVLARLGARLRAQWHLFESLNVWDISALIAGSRVYCGSSLHGRIVAGAYGLPRVNLAARNGNGLSKHAAYAQTWEPALPGQVELSQLAAAVEAALRADRHLLRSHAEQMERRYRTSSAGWLADDAVR